MFNRTRAYDILGIKGLLFLLVSFLVPAQTVDFYLYETYYVLEMPDAFRTMACLLLALYTIYTFLQHKLYSVALIWAHIILTTLTAGLGIFFLYRASAAYRSNFSDWAWFETNNKIVVVTLMAFLLAQVLLAANVLIGIFRRRPG